MASSFPEDPAHLPNMDRLQESDLPGSSRGRQHTQAEWDEMKPTIKELYLDRHFTLAKVMETLSNEHYNFHATTKMYKSQFKKWDFEKNLTSKRVASLLQPAGIGGRIRKAYDAARVDRYLKRRKTTSSSTSTDHSPDIQWSPGRETNTAEIGSEVGQLSPTGQSQSLSAPGSPIEGSSINPRAAEIIPSPRDGFNTQFSHLRPMLFPTDGDVSPSLQDHNSNSSTSKPPTHLAGAKEQCSTPPSSQCQYVNRRGKKFKLVDEISRTQRYQGESWGSCLYDSIESRKCRPDCSCRYVKDTDYLFVVSRYPSFLDVRVEDPELRSILVNSGGNLDRKGFDFAGFGLLARYNSFKHTLDAYRRANRPEENNITEKLALFVEGFLEDGEVWEKYEHATLRSIGYVDNVLWAKFKAQKIGKRINALDRGFQAADCSTKPPQIVLGHDLGLPGVETTITVPPDTDCGGIADDRNPPPECPNLGPMIASASPASNSIDVMAIESQPGSRRAPCVSERPFVPMNLKPPRKLVLPDKNSRNVAESWLFEASKSGALGDVQRLMFAGVNVNCRHISDGDVSSPLMAAVEAGHYDIAQLLINRGANVNQPRKLVTSASTKIYMPLHAAVQNGHGSIAQLLLKKGADIQLTTTLRTPSKTTRLTALQVAIESGSMEMFRLLLLWDSTYSIGYKTVNILEEGDLSCEGKSRDLIAACAAGRTSVAANLLNRGADKNAITIHGTALSSAAQAQKSGIVKLLLKHGADVQVAVLYLARTGQLEVAKDLTRTAYGEMACFENVRDRFIRQYDKLGSVSRRSRSKLGCFLRRFPNYRRAWSAGMKVMKETCFGNVPSDVDETLAFLITARAITETLASDSGDIDYIDKFERDLIRWQLLFTPEDDILSYREAIEALWGVKLTEMLFYDADYEHKESLEEFHRLITDLLDGANMPLDLDNFTEEGLNWSINDWKRWKQCRLQPATLPAAVTPRVLARMPGETPVPLSGEIVRDPGELVRTGPMRPESLSQNLMPDPRPPSPSNAAGVGWFFDTGGMVEYLIRGTIFAMAFIFLDGIISFTIQVHEKYAEIGGIGSIAQRLAIFRSFLGTAIGEGSQSGTKSLSEASIPELGDLSTGTESESGTSSSGTGCSMATQWYVLLSGGVVM